MLAACAADVADELEFDDVVLTWVGEKIEAALDNVLMGLFLRHEPLEFLVCTCPCRETGAPLFRDMG